MFFSTKLAAVFGLIAVANAAPTMIPNSLLDTKDLKIASNGALEKRGINCGNLASGLTDADCEYLNKIGFVGQGINSRTSNGNIWIGNDGPNTFAFTNNATGPVTLVFWSQSVGDFASSFVNVRQPKITYSLTKPGDKVTISLANGVSGGFTTLTNYKTTLSSFGQIYNTWGEFTTGAWATVDVSREVFMGGNDMSIKVKSNGCISDMDTCSFVCKNGVTCGESGTYSLLNCQANSQPGASYGSYDNLNPDGGCMGFSNGGHLDIALGK